MSFARVLRDNWRAIESDLRDAGVDIDTREVLDGQSWPWLQKRINDLLTRPAAGYVEVRRDDMARLMPVFTTRVQLALQPDPDADTAPAASA